MNKKLKQLHDVYRQMLGPHPSKKLLNAMQPLMGDGWKQFVDKTEALVRAGKYADKWNADVFLRGMHLVMQDIEEPIEYSTPPSNLGEWATRTALQIRLVVFLDELRAKRQKAKGQP